MLTPAVSGPRPAPGLNQAVHDVWPQDGSPAAVVFSTMHSKCPLVQERSEGGSMSPGRERPNPWQNRTFAQACSLLCGRPCGDQSQRGKRESPREGSDRANPRGVRAGGRGQRDRSPRKPMGPGKFQTPCASLGQFLRVFSYRGQASVPTTRNRGSGRSPASDFSEDALGKSKWPIRDGFPGEGGRPTAHHLLKIPQEVLGLFPHTPMR